MKSIFLLLFSIYFSAFISAEAQILKPIGRISHSELPCCISGIEKINDSIYFAVSDKETSLYRMKFDKKLKRFDILDTIDIVDYMPSDGKSDFESIRLMNDGKAVLVSTEKNGRNDFSDILWLNIDSKKADFKILTIDSRYEDIKKNSGIEGMAILPDEKTVWLVNERPFVRGANIGKVLFEAYEIKDNAISKRQEVKDVDYFLDKKVTDLTDDNGVSEILYYKNDVLLTTERAFDNKTKTLYVRLYWFNLKTGEKKLALDMNTEIQKFGLSYIENYEGMCYGPMYGGKPTLFMVSDDNANWNRRFGIAIQSTDIVWIKME